MAVVTIDGPAGAGKSTAARGLAQRLGFCFLDTGAMYRVVALAASRSAVDWNDAETLAQLAATVAIRFQDERVFLDDADVTQEIRSPMITSHVRHIANNPKARGHLVALQRRLAQGIDVVTEGRDQGTVAFPAANCKYFLTASPNERARRRTIELRQRGESITLEQVLDQQNRRDREDEARDVGRLVPAEDAVLVNTDGLALEQVIDRLEQLARTCLGRREGRNDT